MSALSSALQRQKTYLNVDFRQSFNTKASTIQDTEQAIVHGYGNNDSTGNDKLPIDLIDDNKINQR